MKGRLLAPFHYAFADELTQFFAKTCPRTKTDCQRGGFSVGRGDGADFDFAPRRVFRITTSGDPMSLDTSTLYLVATMVAALLGSMLLFFGYQENISALRWWGTAYVLGAASVALWTLAGPMLGEMLSLALNAVGFLTCGMVWNASRLFHGRKPNLPGLVLGALVWIAAVMTLGPDSSALRMTIGAGIVAVYAALTATELWFERRRTLQKRVLLLPYWTCKSPSLAIRASKILKACTKFCSVTLSYL